MAETKPAGVLRTLRELPGEVVVLLVGIAINRMGSFVPIFLVLFLTREADYPAARAGMALTAFGLGAIPGVLAGGAITDRVGARASIAGSMTVYGLLVAAVPLLAGESMWLLLVVIACAGATGQLYRPAATAMLAELTPADRLVMASAAMRLGLNTGATLGPLLGASLAQVSYTLVFFVNAAAALLVAAAVLWRLPVMPRGKSDGSAAASKGGYLPALRDRGYVLVVAGTFLVAVVEIQYQTVLPLEVAARGHSDYVFTSLVALNALVVILGELPLTRVLQVLPMRLTMALGSLVLCVGVALFGLPAGLWILVVGTLVWTLGEIVSAPPVSAYPALIAPPELRGRYIGLMATSQSIGYAVGPAIGAALFEFHDAAVWSMCAALGVGAALCIGLGVREPDKTPADADEAAARDGEEVVRP